MEPVAEAASVAQPDLEPIVRPAVTRRVRRRAPVAALAVAGLAAISVAGLGVAAISLSHGAPDKAAAPAVAPAPAATVLRPALDPA
ncbi:MAG TPA: hypothetical protein VFW47_17190, partial [Phenylobacterium sp.]|nr:hypothetical protein [Phenylobacterium sp.]